MNKFLFAAAALALGCASSAVQAAPATDTFDLGVTIVASCTVTAADITFNNIATRDTTASETKTANLTVACTSDAPYEIGLDTGLNEAVDGTAPARLAHAAPANVANDFLTYGLYQDAGYSQPWGMTRGGSNTVVEDTGDGDNQTHTVYAKIDEGQEVSLGGYYDTVTATVWYGADL